MLYIEGNSIALLLEPRDSGKEAACMERGLGPRIVETGGQPWKLAIKAQTAKPTL